MIRGSFEGATGNSSFGNDRSIYGAAAVDLTEGRSPAGAGGDPVALPA